MPTTKTKPSKATADVACPACKSTGPFDVVVYSLYSADARATRIAGDGDVAWEFEPVDWGYCATDPNMQLCCDECGEDFEIENYDW
jgi:hypothetical protein